MLVFFGGFGRFCGFGFLGRFGLLDSGLSGNGGGFCWLWLGWFFGGFGERDIDTGAKTDAGLNLDATMAERFTEWVGENGASIADGDATFDDLELDGAAVSAGDGVSKLVFELGFELRIIGFDVDIDGGRIGVV